MSLQDWAKREVEIASKKERDNAPDGEWDYGVACYKSALKAFNSLCKDGHSGMSIKFTQAILNRLIDGKPLTPIEDTEDEWDDVSHYGNEKRDTQFQCKRMSSLFKSVNEDGAVTYSDVNSYYCIDKNTGTTYTSGLVKKIYHEMFPITFPYYPSTPTKVYCEEFLTDPKNGDFDTVGILYMVKPDGEKIDVYRYFKEGEDFIEIGVNEYEERQKLDKARKEELEKVKAKGEQDKIEI